MADETTTTTETVAKKPGNSKWNLPDTMTAEEKRKERRRLRNAAAKEANGSNEPTGSETTAQAATTKPSRKRTAAPAATVEEEEGGEADEASLISAFTAANLEQDQNLPHGMGFKPLANFMAESMVNKFFIRWGKMPEKFRIMPNLTIILGPI